MPSSRSFALIAAVLLLEAGPPGSREEVDEAMAAAGLVPSRVHTFLPERFFVESVVR